MKMDSPLEVELTDALKDHMTPNVKIEYGHPDNPRYRFRSHKDVLSNNSATFKRKFNSRELDIGSTIAIAYENVEAIEDMLRYFYLQTYNPRLLPSPPMPSMQQRRRLAAHHADVYDLACQKVCGVSGLAGLVHAQFQTGADEALTWLDEPRNNTAKNAVRLLRMYVDLIYEKDENTWESFQGQDIPDMITFWPLRGLVCETAARIWVRAQRWSATSAAGQVGVQERGEEEVMINAGDTGEDVVKKELAKLCWKYAHFAQDFARWMLIKGEVSIALGHNVMGRTR